MLVAATNIRQSTNAGTDHCIGPIALSFARFMSICSAYAGATDAKMVLSCWCGTHH